MSELLAITGGTVIDVRTACNIRKPRCCLTATASPRWRRATGPDGARVIDAAGRVAAGLMDMHAHTTSELNAAKAKIHHCTWPTA